MAKVGRMGICRLEGSVGAEMHENLFLQGFFGLPEPVCRRHRYQRDRRSPALETIASESESGRGGICSATVNRIP
jgi:hypothetical protein